MKEYSLSIKEMLTKGLRPSELLGIDSQYLTECKFMKPREEGLRSALDITNPFSTDEYESFPFPQLIRGNSVTLLAGDTFIEEVNESGSSWTSDLIITYDATEEYTPKSLTPGGVWHFVDLFDTWFLLNGECVVYKTHKVGMITGESDAVLVHDSIDINAGCAFSGRMLLGGFNPDNYWTSAWQTFWQAKVAVFNFDVDTSMPVGENFVMWSTIGGGDLTNLFFKDTAIDGFISEDNTRDASDSLVMDLWRRNEMGLMPMPWQGIIQVMKPLGKGVVVYGESGVALLYPVMEPVPTFGMRKLLNIGVPSRGAVGGDDIQHRFVDTGGKLWAMDTNYNPQMLGYGEYLSPFLGQEMVISLNSEEKEFYISGKDSDGYNYTYILTKTGMGRAPQTINSATFAEGAFIGVIDTPIDTEVIIVTGPFDFGIRDLKTITTIEVGIEAGSDTKLYVAVDYKYETDDDFTRSTWVLLNSSGFARVQKAGVEFRLCIRASDYSGLKIDYANLKWQLSGKRTVRGIYAGASRT